MYFICLKCHRVFRKENTATHVNKCRAATFSCCDCNEELRVQDVPLHTECERAVVSDVPPLSNPKAVQNDMII